MFNGAANVHLASSESEDGAESEVSSEEDIETNEPRLFPTQSQLAEDHTNLLRARLDVHNFIAAASRGCKRTFQEFVDDRSYAPRVYIRDYPMSLVAHSQFMENLTKMTNWQREICMQFLDPDRQERVRRKLRQDELVDYLEATYGDRIDGWRLYVGFFEEVAMRSRHRSPFRIRRALEGNMRTWTKSPDNLPSFFADSLRGSGVFGYRDWLLKPFERDWILAEATLFAVEGDFMLLLIEEHEVGVVQPPQMRSWTEFVVGGRLPRPMD